LKSSGFLDNYIMKAKRKRIDEELMVIKLFASNNARDLLSINILILSSKIDNICKDIFYIDGFLKIRGFDISLAFLELS
jgi:hypothetical protein